VQLSPFESILFVSLSPYLFSILLPLSANPMRVETWWIFCALGCHSVNECWMSELSLGFLSFF
jgi:hypothetical protein